MYSVHGEPCWPPVRAGRCAEPCCQLAVTEPPGVDSRPGRRSDGDPWGMTPTCLAGRSRNSGRGRVVVGVLTRRRGSGAEGVLPNRAGWEGSPRRPAASPGWRAAGRHAGARRAHARLQHLLQGVHPARLPAATHEDSRLVTCGGSRRPRPGGAAASTPRPESRVRVRQSASPSQSPESASPSPVRVQNPRHQSSDQSRARPAARTGHHRDREDTDRRMVRPADRSARRDQSRDGSVGQCSSPREGLQMASAGPRLNIRVVAALGCC